MFVPVNTNRKGFSLLELLVAVAVTAILAGMLFNITTQVMKTQTGSSADLETNQVAQFVLDGMLNKDFDGTEICLWIESDKEEGSANVSASSTLWILEIDPNLSSEERKIKQDQLRGVFHELSED